MERRLVNMGLGARRWGMGVRWGVGVRGWGVRMMRGGRWGMRGGMVLVGERMLEGGWRRESGDGEG